MPRRIMYSVTVTMVLVAAAAGLMSCRRQAGPPVAGEAGNSAGVLLNEILFQPAAGSSFVELLNAGAEAARLDTYALANQAGVRHALPAGLTLPAGAVLVIRFDGTAQAEGTTLHAPQDFLHPETGSVALLLGGDARDEASWSTTGGPSFNLGRGGYIAAFRAGTTLGRPRGSTARGPEAWTVFDPADATPGATNLFPAVTGMMPLSGAILRAPPSALSWYGVPTAARYRVQVAADRSFASPVFDRTAAASGSGIATEQITVPALSPGRYLWRVQAMFGEAADQGAAFSLPAIFWIDAPPNAAVRRPASDWTAGLIASVFAAQPPSAAIRKVLPVPLILQRKDTALLSLEAKESGPMPWDGPWPAGSAPYCARASIAMIAAYFRGNLSQDRISYEGDKDWWDDGPLFDIDVTRGWKDPVIKKALTFAVGRAPRMDFDASQVTGYVKQNRNPAAIYWDLHQAEIDERRPILATTTNHAWVIVGYGEDPRGKYFTVNDPAYGQYDWLAVPVEGVDDADLYSPPGGGISTSFFIPDGARGRSDEPEVSRDSDGDGVMDFDETQRFRTNPRAKDTDSDGVDDKQDIRAWVFDERTSALSNHDRDGDRKTMELDEDSDDGGCFDGVEDANGNGKHESANKESYNFDKNDDACMSGSYHFVTDSFSSRNGSTQKLDQRTTVLFSVREVDGALKGRAIVTASYRQELHDPPGHACSNSIDSTEPYRYVVDVRVNVTAMPDGTANVSVAPLGQFTPPKIRHVSTCGGRPPFEDAGPGFNIGGVLRNGAFHERVDIPLDGATGSKYYETRIRQVGGR